jgi:hypothetical protein
MFSAVLSEVQACNGAQFYAERLKEDGDDIGKEDYEEQFEAV